MRKERRNLNRTLSKALTLLLSVFMLLNSYTPVVTADDYSIQENKQVNKQAITLNSIFNSNPNKTITNNPDGTITVTSWDELAQVINENSTATIIVDGMLAATSQIEIADAKNITIKGINPNDPESGIIYGLIGAKYNSMFKVSNGNLTFGEGLTLSGNRVGQCVVDDSNSSISYDPTNAISLNNSKFDYVKSTSTDMSKSAVSYTPAGTVTAKPGNATYEVEEIKGNHKLSEYLKTTATASLWLGINTELTTNQLNARLYGSSVEAQNGEHYGQYMKVENGRIVYERPGVTKKTLEAVSNFTSFQFSDNPTDPVVVAEDGTMTVPSYKGKFPYYPNHYVVYIIDGGLYIREPGFGTQAQIVGSNPIGMAVEKGEFYWEIEGETFTKDQQTQAQAKVDAINEREKRTIYKFEGEEYEEQGLAEKAVEAYNLAHPAFWMINGDESNPYVSEEAALAAAKPEFKVNGITRTADTPSNLFKQGNDNPIYMLNADETEISSLSANTSYYLKSKDGYYLKASGESAVWTNDAPGATNSDEYSWVLRTVNGVDNVLVNESTDRAIHFNTSISISITGTDPELKVGTNSSKTTIYADLTTPSSAAFTTDASTGAPIKLFTDADATTEANVPLQENGVYYIGTANNYFLRRKSSSEVEWSTNTPRREFFQWTYKNGSFYSYNDDIVIYNDGNNNISFEDASRVDRNSTVKIGTKGQENQIITANTSSDPSQFVVGDTGTKIKIYEIGTTTEATSSLDSNKTYYLQAGDLFLRAADNDNGSADWSKQNISTYPGNGNTRYKWSYNAETGVLYSDFYKQSIIFDGSDVKVINNKVSNVVNNACPFGKKLETPVNNYVHTAADFKTEGDGAKNFNEVNGYFVEVTADGNSKGILKIDGTIFKDFITSDSDTTIKNIAPISVSGGLFEMHGGSIENNRVAYTADDTKSGMHVTHGSGSNVNQIKEKVYWGGGYLHPNNSIVTNSAGAVIFTKGASGSFNDGANIKQNRGDVGALMVTDNSKVVFGGEFESLQAANICKIKNKNGAHIDQNVGFHYAGGVLVEDGAEFFMVSSNSTINSNVTWNKGGAVQVTEWGTKGSAKITYRPNKLWNENIKTTGGKFVLEDGTIANNTAFVRAGAIEVESDYVFLNGGLIAENFCRSLGGAIYVEGDVAGHTYTLHIKQGYIGQNYAITTNHGANDNAGEVGGIYDGMKLADLNKLLNRQLGAEATLDSELGNPINSNSNDSSLSADIADFNGWFGVGGGVWLCSLGGSAAFNIRNDDNLYIDNNYATGKNLNAQGKGTDFYLLNRSDGQVIILDLGNQNWYNELVKVVGDVNAGKINDEFIGRGELYLVNDTNNTTPVYNANAIDTPNYGDVSKRIAGAKVNNTTPISGVTIVNNLSRDGGAIASNGLVLFGDTPENIYEYKSDLVFSKIWSDASTEDKSKVTFKMFYKKDNGSLYELDDMSFELDGNPDDYSGEENVVAAETTVAGSNTWTAQLTMPDSVIVDGQQKPIYLLRNKEYNDGNTTLDPTKPDDIQIIEDLAAKHGSESFIIADDDFKLVVKEYKDGVEITNYRVDKPKVTVTRTENTTSKLDDSGCKIVNGFTLHLTVAGFTMKSYNDKEATIEKYINNVVHDTLYGMDDVIEYEVMAYVPVDADELVIYDTLEDSLMFVNARGNMNQYILNNQKVEVLNSEFKLSNAATNSGNVNIINDDINPIYVIPNNNHKGDGNGSVKTLDNKAEVPSYGIKISDAPNSSDDLLQLYNEIETKNDGNTIYVKLDSAQLKTADARGKWIVVRFNAALKPNYKDIKKLEKDTWVSDAYDKKGSPIPNELRNETLLKIEELNNYLAESNDEIKEIYRTDNNGLIVAKSKNAKYFQYNELGDNTWYRTWADNGTKIKSLDDSVSIEDKGSNTVDTKGKRLGYYNELLQFFGDRSGNPFDTYKEIEQFNILDDLIEYLETNHDGIAKLIKLDDGYAAKTGYGEYYQRTSMGDGKWYKTSLPEESEDTLFEAIDGSRTINSGNTNDEVDGKGKALTTYNALIEEFKDVNNQLDINEFRGYKKDISANWPVVNGAHTNDEEQHSGVPNDASYQVKHNNGSKSKRDSNTVTFDAVQPEKYVNSVVHSDIEYFDKVFDYEIMVYVPEDAERVTVYDTLGDSLMFVDNSGARQYVLNDAGDIKYNGDYSFEESHSSERNVVDGAPSSDDYTGVFNNWFWQGEGTNQTNKSMVYNGNIEVPYTLEDVKENAVVKKRTDRNVYVMLLDGKYYKSTNSATLLETWQADGTTETNTGWNNMWNSMELQNNNIIKDIQGIDAVKETIVNNQLVVHDDNNHKGNNDDDATVNLEGTPIDIKPGMVKIINGSSITNGVYPYNSIKEDYNGNTILLDIYDPDVIEQVQGKWLKLKYKAAIKPNYYKAVADKIASGNIDDDADIAWEKISNNGYIQDPKELTDGIHSGLANTANYIVADRKGNHNSSTNTVTVVPELMSFEITKKWEAKENYDMIPSEVEEFISKLHLYWDKEDVFDDVDSEVTKLFNDVTVTKSNTYQNGAYTWTIKWNNLPKLNSYYVTEARINGFNYPAYTSDNGAYENGTITNKQSSDLTLEIIANKEVIGKDITDKKYEFGLYYDKACTKPVRDNKGNPVTAKNNKETDTTGTIVFDPVSLPSIDNGQYKFYIKEIPGSDGSMTYDSSVKEIVATISNTTENLVKELNAAKVNIGNDVHYFKHYQDAKEVTVNRPVTRNNGWGAVSDRYAFIKDDSNVLVAGWNTGGYQTSGNYWYGYTYHYNYNDVTLQLVPGRYTIYTIDSNNTIHAREFEVVQKGSGIDIKKVVGAQDGYVWYEGTSSNPQNWKSLIEIENKYKYQGEKIVSVVGNNPTFTNTYNSTEIKVEKKWVGDENDLNDRPESVSVELWANGSLYIPQDHEDTVNVARVELKYDEDETKSYKYSWKGLPVKDKNGNLIEYSVKEIVPKNYRLKSIAPEKLTAESSIVTSAKELTGWKSIGYSSFSSGDKIVKIEVNNKIYYMKNATTLASIDKIDNATDYNNLMKNDPDALLWKVTHYYITDTKRVELVFQNVKYPNMYLHGGEKYGYTGVLSASTSPTYFYLIVSGSSVNAMFWWGGNHSYVYYANGTLESPKCQQYPVTFQEPQYEQTTQNINTFTITNEYYPEYNIPNSGGIGTYIFTIAGFMFLTLAFEKIFGFKKIK